MNTTKEQLQQATQKQVVLNFENDNALFWCAFSLISVCETALNYHSDNKLPEYNDQEAEIITGSSNLSINETLRIAKNLIKEYL